MEDMDAESFFDLLFSKKKGCDHYLPTRLHDSAVGVGKISPTQSKVTYRCEWNTSKSVRDALEAQGDPATVQTNASRSTQE